MKQSELVQALHRIAEALEDTDDSVFSFSRIATAVERNTEALNQLSSQLSLSSAVSVDALNLTDHEWNIADAIAVGLSDVKKAIKER